MIYFTSDLHFGHENIIRLTGRPFGSAEEMDRELIRGWNDTVGFDDDVYILGDLTLKGPSAANEALRQLKGRKHLILGNHDHFAHRAEFDSSLLVRMTEYLELEYLNTRFVLFHYPIEEWNGFFRAAVHLHGHRHGSREVNLKNRERGLLRYDVGVDANAFRPISAEEIIGFFAEGQSK